MGIFTRFLDIAGSNINAMIDNAEDPEKMIKLMIREMEDTLVDIKRSCAGVMAGTITVERQLAGAQIHERSWEKKAQRAVEKNRDDLAREALLEKRRYSRRAATLEKELSELSDLVTQYRADIRQLEDKLRSAREKRCVLIQRHIHARRKRQAEEDIRRMDGADAILRFKQFESRIERMEASADLVNYGRKPPLEDKFDRLLGDNEIEEALDALKSGSTHHRETATPI
jgi:phage shock protein A